MGKRLVGSVGLAPGSDSGFDLDTKGQIHGYSSTQYALDVGTNDFVIYADSSTASGLAYGASAKSLFSASGDILYASGANTLAKLAKGSDNEVLTLKSGLPSWEAAGGGTWETLASTKLGSANATIDVTFSAKEYLLFQVKLIVTSASSAAIRYTLNSDTGSNYDYSYTLNSSSSAFSTNQANINPAGVDFTASKVGFMNVWVHNISDQTKLGLSHFMSNQANINSTVGAFEWDNTSAQITSAQFFNDTGGYPSGQYDTGSEVVVLGYDP